MTRNLAIVWVVLYTLFLVYGLGSLAAFLIWIAFIYTYLKLLDRLENQVDLSNSQSRERVLDHQLLLIEKDNLRLSDMNRILLKKLKRREPS